MQQEPPKLNEFKGTTKIGITETFEEGDSFTQEKITEQVVVGVLIND